MKNKPKSFETYLPAFRGYYESIYEPDFEGEAEHFNLPTNFPFWEYFNYKEYFEAISEELCKVTADRLSLFVKSITYDNLYSPREYNFSTDSINCTIEPKIKPIKDFLKTHEEQFKKYIHDHNTSYDGFISFYGNQLSDWKEYTNNFTDYSDKGLYLGFVLDFIVSQMLIEDDSEYAPMSQMDMYDAVSDARYDLPYTDKFYKIVNLLDEGTNHEAVNFEFLSKNVTDIDDLLESESISTLIDRIKKTIQQNYTEKNRVELVLNMFEKYNELIDLEMLIVTTVGEIEANTLKLEL